MLPSKLAPHKGSGHGLHSFYPGGGSWKYRPLSAFALSRSGGGVSYIAPMSYRVHVPYMYCLDLHIPVLYMYVSTVDLAVDLPGQSILVATDPAVK